MYNLKKIFAFFIAVFLLNSIINLYAQDVIIPQQTISVVGANGAIQQVVIPQQVVQTPQPVIQQSPQVVAPQQNVSVVGSDGKIYSITLPQQTIPIQPQVQPQYQVQPQIAPVQQPVYVATPVQNTTAQAPTVVAEDTGKLKTSRIFLQLSAGYFFDFKERWSYTDYVDTEHYCGNQYNYQTGNFEPIKCTYKSYTSYTDDISYSNSEKFSASVGMSWKSFALGFDWDGVKNIEYTANRETIKHSHSLYSFFIQPQVNFNEAIVFLKLGLGGGNSYKKTSQKSITGNSFIAKLGLGLEYRFNNQSSVVASYETSYIASDYYIGNSNSYDITSTNQSINIGYRFSFVAK